MALLVKVKYCKYKEILENTDSTHSRNSYKGKSFEHKSHHVYIKLIKWGRRIVTALWRPEQKPRKIGKSENRMQIGRDIAKIRFWPFSDLDLDL